MEQVLFRGWSQKPMFTGVNMRRFFRQLTKHFFQRINRQQPFKLNEKGTGQVRMFVVELPISTLQEAIVEKRKEREKEVSLVLPKTRVHPGCGRHMHRNDYKSYWICVCGHFESYAKEYVALYGGPM